MERELASSTVALKSEISYTEAKWFSRALVPSAA